MSGERGGDKQGMSCLGILVTTEGYLQPMVIEGYFLIVMG